MGWKESNRVSERLELCRLYEGGSLSMAELEHMATFSQDTEFSSALDFKMRFLSHLRKENCSGKDEYSGVFGREYSGTAADLCPLT